MFSKFIGKKGRSSTQVTRGQSGGEVVIRSFMEELLCTSEMNLGCDHWQVPPNSKTKSRHDGSDHEDCSLRKIFI